MEYIVVGVILFIVYLLYKNKEDTQNEQAIKYPPLSKKEAVIQDIDRFGPPKHKKIKKIIPTKEIDDDSEDVYSVFFDVVGESFKNENGTSRQDIIAKHVQELEPCHLNFYNYKGSLACGVYADEAQTLQVGHIAKGEVQELYDLATSGDSISPRFYEVKGGTDGYKYGVTIEILVEDA